MKTRYKFTVTEVAECQPWANWEKGKDGKVVNVGEVRRQKVKLNADYDSDTPEDQRFQKATPTGSMSLTIDNPAMIDAFKPGESYYVDLTSA